MTSFLDVMFTAPNEVSLNILFQRQIENCEESYHYTFILANLVKKKVNGLLYYLIFNHITVVFSKSQNIQYRRNARNNVWIDEKTKVSDNA